MELSTTVRSILQSKRYQNVWAVSPANSVYEALILMAEKSIGALLVIDHDELVGVLSERDYARKVILLGKSSKETAVHEIMHSAEHTASPDTTVSECMRIMTEQKIRHLPVLDTGCIVGMVSIGDLVNTIISAQQEDLRHLHAYVAGAYPA